MKYLKITTKDKLTEVMFAARRPCVALTENSDIIGVIPSPFGATLSNGILYKGGGPLLKTTDDYDVPYSGFTISANGKTFKSDDDKGQHIIPGSFDALTLTVSIDNPPSNIAALYALESHLIYNMFKPQAYYDYLKAKNWTDDNLKTQLSTNDQEALKALNLDMVHNGFFAMVNDDSFLVYTRGDIESVFPDFNEGISDATIQPKMTYDKDKDEILNS